MSSIFIAFYKGRANNLLERFEDWLTRKITKGKYSHCEIILVERKECGEYEWHDVYTAFSSSPRDKGVRAKEIKFKAENWDLLPLNNLSKSELTAFFEQTKGKKYDWLGVLGLVFKNCQNKNKYFCSEWCGELLGLKEAWRYTPNDLAAILRSELCK